MRLGPYLFALGLTLAVELVLARILGVRDRWDLLLVFGVNLLTNPPVNLLAELVRTAVPRFLVPAAAVLELGAVLVEWVLYRRLLAFRRLHPLFLSLVLNAASFGAGLVWTIYL